MTTLAPIQVSFAVTGLPSGNLEITLDTAQYSFGPNGVSKLNGLVILPQGTSNAQFQEVSVTSKEIYIQGNTTGGTTALTVRTWIIPVTPGSVTGYVTIPNGAQFVATGPLGESGTITSSGTWSVNF